VNSKPLGEPNHWVCKPVLFGVDVSSQSKLGGLWQERAFGVKWGMVEVGHRYSGWGGVQMDCRCICLCYLSHKIQKMASNNGGS